MKFLFIFLLFPILGWGKDSETILKIAEKEIGADFKVQLEKLRAHADLLHKKTPFAKDLSSDTFFKSYIERKNLSETDIEGIKEFFKIQDRPTSRLFIVDEYEIQGFTWDDMKLKNPDNFFRPIADTWQKDLRGEADDIEVCVGECLKFYTVWMSQSSDDLKAYPEDFYFEHISFFVQRPSFDPSVKEVMFTWGGRVHASSWSNKDQSKTFEISQEHAKWLTHDQKEVNSKLAQRIYQSGLLPLKKSLQALTQGNLGRLSLVLELKGLRNIEEAMSFIRSLRKKDPKLALEAELDSLGPQSIKLKCHFAGEEKRFTDLLSSIKELKLSRSYKIESNLVQGVHSVKFLPN